jgi:hypothetical protein
MIIQTKGIKYYILGYTDSTEAYYLLQDKDGNKYAARAGSCGQWFLSPVDPSLTAKAFIQPLLTISELRAIL